MNDELKSAYDLAMEKLRLKDKEQGEKPLVLGQKQKGEIAEVRRIIQAKLAEREILHQSERRKALAAGDMDALQKSEEAYQRDCARLERERESKIETIRSRRTN
ncbi:MAG: hypothetical protein V3U98_04340 [Acidobacteriota bacterium]